MAVEGLPFLSSPFPPGLMDQVHGSCVVWCVCGGVCVVVCVCVSGGGGGGGGVSVCAHARMGAHWSRSICPQT